MNMLTPTGNGHNGEHHGNGSSSNGYHSAGQPRWVVPDEATLSRLANDVLDKFAAAERPHAADQPNAPASAGLPPGSERPVRLTSDLVDLPVSTEQNDTGPADAGFGDFGLTDPLSAGQPGLPSGLTDPHRAGQPRPASGLTDPRPAGQPRLPSGLTDPLPAGQRRPTPTAPVPPTPRSRPPAPPADWSVAGQAAQPSFYFIDERPEVTAEQLAASMSSPATAAGFNVDAVRKDFPILAERVNGKPLIWFDNAATTQKPQCVIDRIAHFYAHENSNIHRGAHTLATRATDAFEDARCQVASFLGAPASDNIVFTRGTTEAINLIAQTWGAKQLRPGDEIVLSHLEHHANIVPWQLLADQTGAKLRIIPVSDDGELLLDQFGSLLSERTKLVAVAHVSNVLGTIVPIDQVIAMAHRAGARVLVDGAQAVAHLPVNVQALDPDFYVFSGHKIFAPTGIGALYAKSEVLAEMPPWQGGGNMIDDVTFERTRYQPAPAKFEAGTGNIADAIGLGAALTYLTSLGLPAVAAYEHQLLQYAISQITSVPGLHLVGTAAHKASVLTFVIDGHDNAKLGQALDRQGIAVRAGHHCAQPILRRFGLESAVRPSLAMYNTCAEVDQLVATLHNLAANPH
jgi:cysteine desulfurase / selenocysteine lyase